MAIHADVGSHFFILATFLTKPILMKPTRLFEYLEYQKKNYPLEKAFGSKLSGDWKFFSTDDMINKSRQLASGLIDIGIQEGDKIGVVAYVNRPEWIIAELACQYIGAISVPLYPTISPVEYEYILEEAEVKAVFLGGEDLFDKVKKAQPNVPTLKHLYTFDQVEGRNYYESIMSKTNLDEVLERKDKVKPDDLATIIYTSGTTGNPKGVMLTHNNIISVVDDTIAMLPIKTGQKTLSFLPFCHIFERAVYYGYLYKGVTTYCTGTTNLGGEDGDLRAVQPSFFSTVPRLLEKVYEKIYGKGLELTGLKKKLFFWALDLTDDYEIGKTYSGLAAFKRKIANKLIFSKWREALGGNLIAIVTGAAPCPAKIARVFSAAGIPILEGYGLTETSPTLSINRYQNNEAMIGTVGPAIPSVTLKIDASDGEYKEGEGEILAIGPGVMQGYYKKPDKTAEVFKEIDGQRWFRTGDIGKWVKGPGGKDYLKITDRKKELLKTSGGKYVAPAPIEGKLKENFLIENVMVVGDKKKFVSALIVPSAEVLKDWCGNNDVAFDDINVALKDPKVIDLYQRAINDINPLFSHVEQIKKFTLLGDTWESVKTDNSDAELTPTMKLKRRVIRDKCAGQIDAMYS